MGPKLKCAEYSFIQSQVWDLSGEEIKNMMTLPPSKIPVTTTEPQPELKTELLKCVPLQNLKNIDGKNQQRFRYLACVAVADGKGSVGIGEKIAGTRKLAELKARDAALLNYSFIGTKLTKTIDAKCLEISLQLSPSPIGSGCTGSPLARKIMEIIGINDCCITGGDNSLSTVRALAKALRKIN